MPKSIQSTRQGFLQKGGILPQQRAWPLTETSQNGLYRRGSLRRSCLLFFFNIETKVKLVMIFANFVGTSPLRSWGYISIRSPLSTHFFHLCLRCHDRFRVVCPGIREIKTTNWGINQVILHDKYIPHNSLRTREPTGLFSFIFTTVSGEATSDCHIFCPPGKCSLMTPFCGG